MSPTEVFNVFHHSGSLNVACHKQSDASPCYPARTITDGGTGFSTSNQSGTYLDQASGKLYVYAVRNDNTAGVVCVDTTVAATNPNPFCGFTALTAVGDATNQGAGLPMKVGSKLYAVNWVSGVPSGDQDKLMCFDLDTAAACAGQPYALDLGPGSVALGSFGFGPATAAVGNQILVPVTTTGTARIACYDAGTGAECAGAWPIEPPAGSVGGDGSPFPLLAANGAINGFCLATPTTPCFALDGTSTASPAGLAAAMGGTSSPYNNQAVTIGARAYIAHGDDNTIRCYNFAAAAECENFPHPTPNASYIYTVNRDPQRPTCIWVNADGGSNQIQNFDAFTGGPCGQGATRVLSEQLVASDKQCEPATYRKFEVLKPERSGYADGTLGFADNNGGATGIADRALDGAGAVDLTGIGLEAIDRPQFLVSLNGTGSDPSEVQVRLTWEGIYDPACLGEGITAPPPAEPVYSIPTPGPGSTTTPPAGGVQGETATNPKRCKGRRKFRIVLRKRHGVVYKSAKFKLNGKKIKARRFGKRKRIGAVIDLRKTRKKKIVLRIRAVTSAGKVLKGKRVYHPCTKKRKKGPPKL